MIITPPADLPYTGISVTGTRIIVPKLVIIITSSSSVTAAIPAILPVLAVL